MALPDYTPTEGNEDMARASALAATTIAIRLLNESENVAKTTLPNSTPDRNEAYDHLADVAGVLAETAKGWIEIARLASELAGRGVYFELADSSRPRST
jgi:hypothetical protein